MTNLHVLVIENEPGVADTAVGDLTARGHQVLRCHAPGAPAFPCKATTDPRRCPLYGEVDVALAVRDERHAVSPYELGVTCAVRAGVPIVVQAPKGADRFGHLAEAHADVGSVAAACELVAYKNWITNR